MVAQGEVCQRAFPEYERPLVTYGLPYTEACRKHVEQTFKASRVYIISSASLARDTTALSDLQQALDGKLAGR